MHTDDNCAVVPAALKNQHQVWGIAEDFTEEIVFDPRSQQGIGCSAEEIAERHRIMKMGGFFRETDNRCQDVRR